MAAIKDDRYAVGSYFAVSRQQVHQRVTAQQDILLIQRAQGWGLPDKIISIYDDMKGHFKRQCLRKDAKGLSLGLLQAFDQTV